MLHRRTVCIAEVPHSLYHKSLWWLNSAWMIASYNPKKLVSSKTSLCDTPESSGGSHHPSSSQTVHATQSAGSVSPQRIKEPRERRKNPLQARPLSWCDPLHQGEWRHSSRHWRRWRCQPHGGREECSCWGWRGPCGGKKTKDQRWCRWFEPIGQFERDQPNRQGYRQAHVQDCRHSELWGYSQEAPFRTVDLPSFDWREHWPIFGIQWASGRQAFHLLLRARSHSRH